LDYYYFFFNLLYWYHLFIIIFIKRYQNKNIKIRTINNRYSLNKKKAITAIPGITGDPPHWWGIVLGLFIVSIGTVIKKK
jgi:hypothetical protein